MGKGCFVDRVFIMGSVILMILFSNTASADPQKIDWGKVSESKLTEKLATVLMDFEPVMTQKTVVIVPLPNQMAMQDENKKGKKEGKKAKSIPASIEWNIQAFFSNVMANILKTAGIKCADPNTCKELIYDNRGRARTIGNDIALQIAKKAGAGIVLVPRLTKKSGSYDFMITVHDGETGKVIRNASGSLTKTDSDYLANTPKTNRKIIQWVESKFGQKIDRGECWDVVAKGMEAAGTKLGPEGGFDFGRKLEEGETPFPGDPIATKDRSHTMISYYSGDDVVTILHQNWNWGKEDGRKVGWGATSLKANDFWRVRPAPDDTLDEIVKNARAKAEEKRAKAKAEEEKKQKKSEN